MIYLVVGILVLITVSAALPMLQKIKFMNWKKRSGLKIFAILFSCVMSVTGGLYVWVTSQTFQALSNIEQSTGISIGEKPIKDMSLTDIYFGAKDNFVPDAVSAKLDSILSDLGVSDIQLLSEMDTIKSAYSLDNIWVLGNTYTDMIEKTVSMAKEMGILG